MPVSLVVLTHNEEHNIAACLASAQGFDDLNVVDSGSTDRTCAIAESLGAKTYYHAFSGFGQQRNWAIDQVPARYDWQLQLDADERLTPQLIAEITAAVTVNQGVGGYLIPSKLMFAGRWLRHAGQYPGYQLRLFHCGRVRFEDYGHGQREVTSFPVRRLQQPYLHFAFSRGLDHWFAKHAGYARREAEQALGLHSLNGHASGAGGLLDGDSTRRRRALKHLSARLPCRYLLRLFYMLSVHRAFLDGVPGLVYAHMLATYEAMIEVNLSLLKRGLKP